MTPQFLEIMEREQGSLSTEQRDTSFAPGFNRSEKSRRLRDVPRNPRCDPECTSAWQEASSGNLVQ